MEAFLFGYWGWGSNTELLLDVTAQVEAKRGFAPPCFVDIRVSRSVRAAGFREQAFEKLAGPDRYLWMPELGNKRITERATGIEIVEPRAAERLLDLIVARREKNQRVIFFCACEFPGTSAAPQCHRRVVADLLVGAARSRGVSLVAGEWPGGEPVEVTVDLSPKDYKKLLGRAATLKTALPTADAAGLPWGSIVTARCDGESYSRRVPFAVARCSNVDMRDEEKLEAFVQASLDDTLSGLEDLLPPDAMACVRGRLEDDFHAHPVLSRLVKELALAEGSQVDVGAHPDVAAEAEGLPSSTTTPK